MAENNKIGIIISFVVALLLLGILLPIGLTDLVAFDGTYNSSYLVGTVTSYNAGTNATVATIVSTVIPIIIIIGIILLMVGQVKKNEGM